jgi:hypothetical protein
MCSIGVGASQGLDGAVYGADFADGPPRQTQPSCASSWMQGTAAAEGGEASLRQLVRTERPRALSVKMVALRAAPGNALRSAPRSGPPYQEK